MPLLLSSCVDMVDANRDVLVYGLGLDAGPEGEVVVTLHFLSPSGAAGGGTPVGSMGTDASSSVTPLTLSASGQTFTQAVERLRFQVPGRIYMGDVRAIFFGEGLTRQGLKDVMDALLREPFTMNSAYVLFTRGDASRFLAMGPNGTSAVLAALGIFDGDSAGTVLLHPITLWQLFNAVWTDYWVDWGPWVTASPQEAQVIGHVILRDGRWQAAVPTGEEATLLRSIRPGGPAQMTLPLAEGLASFRFTPLTTKARLKGSRVEVTVAGRASLVEWKGGPQPPVSELQRRLNEAVKERTDAFLRRMYREEKIDVLNVAETMRTQSPGGKLPADFLQRLEELSFQVVTRITISDTARSR